ncbi:MAG TPA: hypothetical protein VMH23_09410 [Bacteroidota bacterium]|nr:hypothetical protein [Bacteroidota bacterium]
MIIRRSWLGIGSVTLGLLPTAEFTTVRLRGLASGGLLQSLDPVSGAVYHVLLRAFTIAPSLVDVFR